MKAQHISVGLFCFYAVELAHKRMKIKKPIIPEGDELSF